MMDEELEKAAYHEGGHAYLAVYVGARVCSVTVDPDWDDGPARYGDTQVEWPVEAFSAQELREKQILVCLAGPVAEMISTGDPFHPAMVAEWSQDWNSAWKIAAPLVADPQKRMRYLELVTKDLYQLLNRKKHWTALSAVVDHLLAHETLEGEEVAEIVQEWLEMI